MSDLDLARIRAETPGCLEVTHLNNAGSSLPPAAVVDTVVSYLREEARFGGYELADRRKAAHHEGLPLFVLSFWMQAGIGLQRS